MTNLSALEAFIRTNPDARELKRALAVKMTLSQYTHGQIESLLGVTSGFISKWKHRYLAEGVETLSLAHRWKHARKMEPLEGQNAQVKWSHPTPYISTSLPI